MASGNLLAGLLPRSSYPPATNYATQDQRNTVPVLDFDAATEEAAYFSFRIPDSYSGGGLSIKLNWMATSATTGDVKWGVSVERHDTGNDLDSDSLATEQTGTTTTSGTSGAPVVTTITASSGANMDSAVAGDMVRLKVARKAADGADTMAGDAELESLAVYET